MLDGELAVHGALVSLHGIQRDVEPRVDLASRQPGGEQAENLSTVRWLSRGDCARPAGAARNPTYSYNLERNGGGRCTSHDYQAVNSLGHWSQYGAHQLRRRDGRASPRRMGP